MNRLVIALSGGVDSVVLLHALCQLQLNKPISAVHINHGLQPAAKDFELLCRSVCQELGVALEVREVQVETTGSMEANARDARYAEFEAMLDPGDLLLMAHHSDDQVETALFRLFRGSRVIGLEGMPKERALGAARLFRPLLEVSQSTILAYAAPSKGGGLNWIDDPSNLDTAIDRNYIRLTLIPSLEARLPDIKTTLLDRLARDQALREFLAQEDAARLEELKVDRDCLDLAGLKSLSEPMRERVVTAWLINLALPLPTGKMLREFCGNFLAADAGLMAFKGYEFRKHKGHLYVLRELPVALMLSAPLTECAIATAGGCVTNEKKEGQGLRVGEQFTLRSRSGGETLQLRHERKLKNLFQESGVPAWLRDRLPLIYHGNELVALAALPAWDVTMMIADGWTAPGSERGWEVSLGLEDRLA